MMQCGIIIGITSTFRKPGNGLSRHFVDTDDDYAYESNGRVRGGPRVEDRVGTGFDTGDIVTIIVNNGDLQFEVNDKLQWKVQIKNIDLKYKLAVSMTDRNASVTFV